MSRLKTFVEKACNALAVEVDLDFTWHAEDGTGLQAVALLPTLGDENGMLIFDSFKPIEKYVSELRARHFGFAVLSEPSAQSEFDLDSFRDMFSDWGWCGSR